MKSAALVCLLAIGVFAFAQQPQKVVGPQPVNSSTGIYYPLPAAPRAQIRDFQYQYDQLEIQNQQLLLQVEKNRAQQRELVDGERRVAWEYATEKHIDLALFELDSADVKFIPKKKAQ
jgi:hypothetical protein